MWGNGKGSIGAAITANIFLVGECCGKMVMVLGQENVFIA